MAEWFERRTCISVTPISSRTLAVLVLGYPEFKSLAMLVNNQIVPPPRPVGIINTVKFNVNYLFQHDDTIPRINKGLLLSLHIAFIRNCSIVGMVKYLYETAQYKILDD